MLESIQSPQDLHKMSITQLNTLATEIRERIISQVVAHGGHFGANLGIVELTLALHSSLNSPTDKIVWDVGHQSYPHKLVTGRYNDFGSLRKLDGISGFPRICESPHDVFGVGHSSTSISAALGMATARDLQQQDHVVAAVIGDGALTGGMAFEALNHAGQLDTDLIVVLNDNAMSIANNVGALNDYLNRLRLDPTLSRAKSDLENFIKRIPAIGGSMSRLGLSLKDAVKSLLPGQLFEELGFSYFGPINGHSIHQLQMAINEGIRRGGPVLIHVLTQKGKGYAPAEKNPSKYHGIGPSNVQEEPDDLISFSSVFGNSLVELAKTDERIVAITAAMKDGTGLEEFAEVYPTRFFDVGIAEQHALTYAAGLATQGVRPFVALYSTFLQRGYDQVLHDICIQELPVIIGIDRAGVVGDDGPTHHGVFDISFLRHIPNLCLLAPRNGSELKAMIRWSLNQNKPVAIRYPRAQTSVKAEIYFHDQADIPCEVLAEGNDCVIFAIGNMVEVALETASLLKLENINCTVVNVRSLKPLDETTMMTIVEQNRSNLVFTIEDHVVAGGFGSSILELFKDRFDLKIFNFGYPDQFVEQGTILELHQRHGLTAKQIATKINNFLEKDRLQIVEGDF